MITLSTPDGELPDYYLNLCGPMLARYKGPLKVVVDLGAHVGAFSVLAAKEFGADLVFAVEPDPVNFSHLVINVEMNNLSKNIIPIMACIAPESYKVERLYFGGTSGQQGTTFDPARFPYREVRTLSLKDLFRIVPRTIDFLKVDIEGSEWSLFEKPEKIWNLLKRAKYLNIEFHPTNDPKYHAEQKTGEIDMAVSALKHMGFDLYTNAERFDYFGHLQNA